MSEEFARVLVRNLNRKIRFCKNHAAELALINYRDAIIETMTELGHDTKGMINGK